MANNRMYLACRLCAGAEFFLAKYYPSTGWYTSRPRGEHLPESLDAEMNAWFDQHEHGTESGDFIVLRDERTQ